MKQLINRLICLCKGHEWENWGYALKKQPYRKVWHLHCKRCGKDYYEEIKMYE